METWEKLQRKELEDHTATIKNSENTGTKLSIKTVRIIKSVVEVYSHLIIYFCRPQQRERAREIEYMFTDMTQWTLEKNKSQ